MAEAQDRVALVMEITRAVTGRRRLDEMLEAAFHRLRPVLCFTGGSIQLVNDDGLVHVAAADPPPYQPIPPLPLAGSVPGRIVMSERPLYLADLPGDRESAERLGLGRRVVRSYYGVPLVVDGSAIGLLQIDADAPDAWDADQLLALAAAAPVIAAAIVNTRTQAERGEIHHRLAGEARRRSELADFVRAEIAPTVAALLEAAGTGATEEDAAELRRRLRLSIAEARRLAGYVTRLEALLAAEPVRHTVTLPEAAVPTQTSHGPRLG